MRKHLLHPFLDAFAWISLVGTILLAACLPVTPVSTGNALETESSPPSESEPCAYRWVRRPLPEESATAEEILREEFPQIEVRAEAYGEECVNAAGEVLSFQAMETDFHLTIRVEDLKNEEELGEMLRRALNALATFPVETAPGGKVGYIGVVFKTETESLHLWFEAAKARSLLDAGIGDAALFRSLK